MNKNELIIERVRELVFKDLEDERILARMTQIEEPNLEVSSEGEEVVNAVGSPITTLYRSKKATLTGSNSLLSLDLVSRQLGTNKVIADSANKIDVPISEIVKISGGKAVLKKTPKGNIKYVYKIENNDLSKTLTLATGAEPTDEEHFTISGKTITVKDSVEGKLYVSYKYEADEAVKIVNSSETFPETTAIEMSVICSDVCNPNIKFLTTIIAPNAKLDPSSISLALNSSGKHPFTIDFNKSFCDEDAELFTIIVAEK